MHIHVMRTQVMVEGQGKAPLGSGESSRATNNGVNLRDLSVTVSWLRTHNLAWGDIHVYARPDSCRIDSVSIGRDPLTRPFTTGRADCE
jgi:hypothetical protein